jgi:hypothetical protein
MIGISTTMRNSRLQLILDAIDLGGDEYGAGILLIYSGTRPATGLPPDEYDAVLVEFMLPFPCGVISDGVLTFGAVSDVLATASGVATWARLTDINDNFVADLSVTSLVGSGDVKIDSTDIVSGGVVHCNSAVITEGNA